MQRLFSTFPAGWPGFGLLLLRSTIAVTLIVPGFAYLLEQEEIPFGAWAVCLLAVASGVSLLVGFWTPFAGSAAAIACLGATFLLLPAGKWNLFHGNPLSLDVVVMAITTAVLGPGHFRWMPGCSDAAELLFLASPPYQPRSSRPR